MWLRCSSAAGVAQRNQTLPGGPRAHLGSWTAAHPRRAAARDGAFPPLSSTALLLTHFLDKETRANKNTRKSSGLQDPSPSWARASPAAVTQPRLRACRSPARPGDRFPLAAPALPLPARASVPEPAGARDAGGGPPLPGWLTPAPLRSAPPRAPRGRDRPRPRPRPALPAPPRPARTAMI